MTSDPSSLSGGPSGARSEHAASVDELTELKLDLWSARDAAIGAVAEAGTLRMRVADLEAHVNQLRVELDRLAHVEQSLTFKVGNTMLKPLKTARRLSR